MPLKRQPRVMVRKAQRFSAEHNSGYLWYWIFSFTLQSCFELPKGPLLSCLALPLSFEKCTYFQQTVTCLRQHFLKIKQNIKWLWPPAVTSAAEVGLGNTESSSREQFVAALSRINRNVGHFFNTVEGSLRFGAKRCGTNACYATPWSAVLERSSWL